MDGDAVIRVPILEGRTKRRIHVGSERVFLVRAGQPQDLDAVGNTDRQVSHGYPAP